MYGGVVVGAVRACRDVMVWCVGAMMLVIYIMFVYGGVAAGVVMLCRYPCVWLLLLVK